MVWNREWVVLMCVCWGPGKKSSRVIPASSGVLSTDLSASFTVNIQNRLSSYLSISEEHAGLFLVRMLCRGPRMLFFGQNMLDIMAFCTSEIICFPWAIRIMSFVGCYFNNVGCLVELTLATQLSGNHQLC